MVQLCPTLLSNFSSQDRMAFGFIPKEHAEEVWANIASFLCRPTFFFSYDHCPGGCCADLRLSRCFCADRRIKQLHICWQCRCKFRASFWQQRVLLIHKRLVWQSSLNCQECEHVRNLRAVSPRMLVTMSLTLRCVGAELDGDKK